MRFFNILAITPLIALSAGLPQPQEPSDPDDGKFISARILRFSDRGCQNLISESVYRTPILALRRTASIDLLDGTPAGSIILTTLAPGCTLAEGAAGFLARFGNFQPPLSSAETDFCFVQSRQINDGQIQELNFDKTSIDCVNQNH
jgi:hypothetical protein